MKFQGGKTGGENRLMAVLRPGCGKKLANPGQSGTVSIDRFAPAMLNFGYVPIMGDWMKSWISAVAATVTLFSMSMANAAVVTVGGVTFDTDDHADDVIWARGGVFSGLPANLREACNPPLATSTVGPNGISCRADELDDFDLNDFVELDENATTVNPPDALAIFFDKPLINGVGIDLVIYEEANQSDNPALTLVLGGAQLTGVVLDIITINGKKYTISGFDFSNSPLNIALGATIGLPIFLQTFNQVGSADISAIIGVNFGQPTPEIPLPAALPLFFAGLAGLGFAARRRRQA